MFTDMSKLKMLKYLFLFVSLQSGAQTVTPDVQDKSKWNAFNRTAEPATDQGRKVVRLSEAPGDGMMILKDVQFSQGTIEVDVRGKNVPQQSFVGIAFHVQNITTYDAIYFRPFNFSNADTVRRRRAVQYVAMPNFPWEKLRQEFPGKYENKVSPVPDPDGWFHVKITIEGKLIKVYVDNAETPSLQVEKYSPSTSGGIALWVGNTSGGSFANLKLTPDGATSTSIPYGDNPETGRYFDAGDAKLYYETYGEGEPILLLHGGVYGYISEYEYLIPRLAEKYKVICLATRGHGKSEIGKQPYSYSQRAQDAYKLLKHLDVNKAIVIGFSDGAYTGYKLAATYPDVVTKLVGMGAGDRPKDPARKPSNYSEDALMKTSGNYFTPLKKLMPEPERWNESLQMLNQLYNNDVITTDTFTKIKCPVLVMSGDKDEFASINKVVACYKKINDAKLSVIPGCGHVIFYCNFPAVWEAMKGFVGTTQAGN